MLLRSLRSLQVLLSAPNKNKTNRNYSVRFFISWFATGLVTMQCIVCTLRVPLHAADASLPRINSPVPLLRSLRSLQVLLSAPNKNKTNRNYSVRFFISWFATGLVTMQGIVCTLRVPLHAADAPLGNNIALLALLRSFYSLQVLLSAPKKDNPKGLSFFMRQRT